MSSFYKPRPLTDEEREIDEAMNTHMAMVKDELHALVASTLFYSVGFMLIIFSAENTRPSNMGSGFLICGALLMIVHIVLGFRARKYKRKALKLVNTYLRKQALPFYNELVEMFADKNVHLHLNDNGSITITDNRVKEEK